MNFLKKQNLVVFILVILGISSICLFLMKYSKKSYGNINTETVLMANHSDNDIIIWGISHRLRETINLMKKARFNILAIVNVENDNKGIKKIFGIKVIKKKDIPKNIKIVSSYTEEADYSLFLKCLKFGIKNGNKCLHPVFALFDIEFPNTTTTKIKQYGAPGAGNTLVQSFIQDHLPKQNKNDEEVYYTHIATHYYNLLKREAEKTIQVAFSDLDNPFELFGITVTNLYNAAFHFVAKNRGPRPAFAFTSIPCPIFAFSEYTASHELPTKESIDFYKKKKFKQILVIRHPLENMLSILRKNTDLLGLDKVINRYPDLLNSYVQPISIFYKHVLKNMDDLYVVKYEDVISSPIDTLYKLANHLNLPVDKEKIRTWWDKNGFKNLTKDNRPHFMGGGNDKWKQSFPQSTFDIFENSGMIQISNILGYSANYNDFISDTHVGEDVDPLQVLYYKNSIKFLKYIYWMKNDYGQLITPQGNKIYFYDINEKIKSYDFSDNINLLSLVDAMILNIKS